MSILEIKWGEEGNGGGGQTALYSGQENLYKNFDVGY